MLNCVVLFDLVWFVLCSCAGTAVDRESAAAEGEKTLQDFFEIG